MNSYHILGGMLARQKETFGIKTMLKKNITGKNNYLVNIYQNQKMYNTNLYHLISILQEAIKFKISNI